MSNKTLEGVPDSKGCCQHLLGHSSKGCNHYLSPKWLNKVLFENDAQFFTCPIIFCQLGGFFLNYEKHPKCWRDVFLFQRATLIADSARGH